MYKENENGPREIDLPGGVKGALWTLAGGAIASVAKNFGVNVGGLLGGNNCNCGCNTGCGCAGNSLASAILAEKDSEIAMLKAEKYSDNAAETQANRLLVNYLKPYGDAISASQAENARLTQQLKDNETIRNLEKELMMKEVQLAKQEAKCCCEKNAMAIAQVQYMVNQISAVRVLNDVLCPGIPTVEITHPTTTAAAA